MDAQTRWEDKRADDCAEAGQPKCPKFPDHDCEECHESHREGEVFNKLCIRCSDEFCNKCKGKGWIKLGLNADMPEEECDECDGAGRVSA